MSERRRKANEARAAVIDRLRDEGLEAAYERGIKLLKDDNVPATAHASLVRVMFDAAGVLKSFDDDRAEKEPHEMTGEEIAEKIAEAKRLLDRRSGQNEPEDDAEAEAPHSGKLFE